MVDRTNGFVRGDVGIGSPVRAVCCAAICCLWLVAPAMGQEPGEKEKKLGERLVRKAINDADEGIMAGLIRMMDEVSGRLDLEFDTGEQTQAIQKQIMEKLDEAIKQAAQQKGSGKRQKRQQSDKRKKKDAPDKQSGKRSGQQQEGSSDGKSQEAASGKADAVMPGGGDGEGDARRAWGHLPERERDEVIQGVDEEFLEAYRMWIERYYRALQESHD